MLAFDARRSSCVDVFVAHSKDAIDRRLSYEKSMRCNVDTALFVLNLLLSFTACWLSLYAFYVSF